MQGWLFLLGIAVIVIVLRVLRTRWKSESPSGRAAAELARLVEARKGETDRPEDLAAWEQAMAVLERFPSDYNKANEDFRFVPAFAAFLEKHHPEHPRLESLRQYANYRKDSIWGIPLRRDE